MPGKFLFRIAFGGTIDFKLSGMIHGGLYAQDLPRLVVHFERVPIDAVPKADSFGPMLQSAAHLAPTTRWVTTPQEAQYVRASEGSNGVMQKLGIKGCQRSSLAKDYIGGVLALGGAPIVALAQRGADLAVQGMGFID